jgi:hypothetical protein
MQNIDELAATAAADQSEEARMAALRSFMQLAAAAENKGQLWEHDGARDALVGSAATDQPDEVRLQALGALGHLAIANVNEMRIWQHDDARSVLLGAAAAGQSVDVRVVAFEAMRKVTCMQRAPRSHPTLHHMLLPQRQPSRARRMFCPTHARSV